MHQNQMPCRCHICQYCTIELELTGPCLLYYAQTPDASATLSGKEKPAPREPSESYQNKDDIKGSFTGNVSCLHAIYSKWAKQKEQHEWQWDKNT